MNAPNPPDDTLRHAEGECRLHDGRWSCWPRNLTEAGDVDDHEFAIYTLASEHFRHDLTQFWNHSTFFALLQGGLISVAVTSLGPRGENQTRGVLDPRQIACAVAVVGLLLALFWAMVAWRRATLIQKWREQVVHLDGRVNRHAMYQRIEPHVGAVWWYGPTKLTVALPVLIAAIWLVLIAALGSVWLGLVVLCLELAAFAWVVVTSWTGRVRS